MYESKSGSNPLTNLQVRDTYITTIAVNVSKLKVSRGLQNMMQEWRDGKSDHLQPPCTGWAQIWYHVIRLLGVIHIP